MSFGNALHRPFTDWKKLGIGALVTLVPILNFATFGYALRCANTKKDDLPDWSEFGELWVSGIVALIISLIYAIPYMIIMFATVGTAMMSAFSGSGSMMFGTLGGGMLITVLVGLLTFYIAPVAVLRANREGFGAAFHFGDVFRNAFTGTYFMAWFLGMVGSLILIFAGWLAFFLLALTLILMPIGFLAYMAAIWAANVTAWTLIGEAVD